MENVANLSVRGNSEAEGAEEDSETAVESSEVPVACEESYRSHCVHYKRGCSIVVKAAPTHTKITHTHIRRVLA